MNQRLPALRWAWLVLPFLSFATRAASPILLPLEVIGPDGYVAAVRFELDDAAGVDGLYLKAHRLAYRDASTNPERGAKGSVKLNDGPWIDLDNSTVTCYEHEAAYGCLSGAYHTVRFSVPIKGAQPGENTLRFRFNGTDGFSSGYRVLEMNLLRGSQPVLSPESFAQDDPTTWQPPLNNASDIAQGKVLWEEAKLADFPGGPMIKATCSGCHPADGRDLEYFAFSNWSIQERAKFHGLDQKQAEQIASYIRSLGSEKDIQRLGRPWNPPYQPGPGLDSQPVEAWSAGAGLDWVLEEDRDMVKHAFGGSLAKSSVGNLMDIDKTHNAREEPLSIQLPDWQEWLPEVHPIDVPRIGEKFYDTPAMHGESFFDTYQRTLDLLNAHPTSTLAADGRLKEQLYQLAAQTTNMNSRMKKAFGFTSSPGTQEDDKESIVIFLLKWGAVKTWEIMQAYKLEGLAPQVFGEYGEPRSWISSRRNVFEIAPHRSASNDTRFAHQDVLTGKYFSTAWYHLQLVINAGNRETLRLWPVDWNYQPAHISGLHSRGGGPKHPYRYAISHAKMLQQYHDGKPIKSGSGSSGIGFRQIHPGRYVPIPNKRAKIFEDLPSAERALLMEGMLNATMDLIETHAAEEWPRDTLDRNDNTLRPSTYQPKLVSEAKYGNILHKGHYADIWYTMIPYFQEAGVDEVTLNRLVNWGKAMWPLGDWDGLQVTSSSRVSAVSVSLPAEDFVSEAVQTDNPDNAWAVFSRYSDYQGRGYVATPNNTGQAKSGGFDHGARLSYSFELPQDDTYHLWVRRFARSIGSNSAYFGLDGIALDTVDNGQEVFYRWHWVKLASPKLEAGEHTLELVRRENGYLVDAFLLTTTNQDPNQAGNARQGPVVAKSAEPTVDASATVSVYPNPVVDDVLHVVAQPGEVLKKVVVLDTQGKQFVQRVVDGQERLQLNISTLPPGLYVVKTYGQQQTFVEKVLVK